MTLSKTPAGASRRASVFEWAQTALLVINLAWTTLCLGGFLAETMVVSSALLGALLVIHFLDRAVHERSPRGGSNGGLVPLHPAGWLLLPFLFYAAGNVFWLTPLPWLGWFDWLGWAQITGVFWVVLNGVRSRPTRIAVFATIVALGCGLVSLACYQRFVAPDWLMLGRIQAAQFHGRASGSFGSPNSLAAFLLLVLPGLGALTLRRGATATHRVFWGYLTVLFALGLIWTISRGAWLALGMVLGVCPLIVVRGSVVRRLGWSIGAWLCLGLLSFAVYSTAPTIRQRIETMMAQRGELSRPIMWEAAWKNFAASPAFGTGGGSYGVRFDQHRPENFQLEARWSHNDYLNTLSDYGWVGFGLLVGGWSGVVFACSRSAASSSSNQSDQRAFTVGLAAGLAAFLIQLSVDFSLKIPALAMAFATLAALFVQRAWPAGTMRPGTARRRADRVICFVVAMGVAASTALLVVPFYRGEAERQTARQTIDGMAPGRSEPNPTVLWSVRDELVIATKLSPSNGHTWADLAYVTSALAQIDAARAADLAREAERAADRALAISPLLAEFWVRKGVALDIQGRWLDAGKCFVEALKCAPTRAGIWYQRAVHLSLNPTQRGPALAAAELALRLDPGNPEAHALRQRLAERSHAP